MMHHAPSPLGTWRRIYLIGIYLIPSGTFVIRSRCSLLSRTSPSADDVFSETECCGLGAFLVELDNEPPDPRQAYRWGRGYE